MSNFPNLFAELRRTPNTNSPGLMKPGSLLTVALDGTTDVKGITFDAIPDSGPLFVTDQGLISRIVNSVAQQYSLAYNTIISIIRQTPAGSRTAALPAVLNSTDHNKNILLTGSTGNLSVDGSVIDGFFCNVINTASGAATYSGITGLGNSTSLAAGAYCKIIMGGATVYATPSSSAASLIGYPTLPNTTLWAIWDASTINGINGSTVSAINDASNNNRGLSGGSTGTTLVTGAANGLNGISFSGAANSQALHITSSAVNTLAGSMCGFIVVKNVALTNNTFLWMGNANAINYNAGTVGQDQCAVYLALASPNYYGINRISNSNTSGAASSTVPSASLIRIAWRYNPTFYTVDFWLNGVKATTGTNTAGPNATYAWDTICLGAANSGNTVFTGLTNAVFLEAEIFSGNFGDPDVTNIIEPYLINKWGTI